MKECTCGSGSFDPHQHSLRCEVREPQTFLGIPVVVTDAVVDGEAYVGRLPTPEEVQEHGSFEAAIEAQAHQWAKIKNLNQEEK